MSNKPQPHHVNFACDDVALTAAFYQNLLGLKQVDLPRNQDAYGAELSLLQDEHGYQYHIIPSEPDFAREHNLPVNPLAGGHLAFRVRDIESIRTYLDSEGIPYADMGEWAIKGWHQIFCADPDGRVIEFHQVLDD